jgi:hypothetical protein
MELELHCFKVLQKIEADALGKRVNKLVTEVGESGLFSANQGSDADVRTCRRR